MFIDNEKNGLNAENLHLTQEQFDGYMSGKMVPPRQSIPVANLIDLGEGDDGGDGQCSSQKTNTEDDGVAMCPGLELMYKNLDDLKTLHKRWLGICGW